MVNGAIGLVNTLIKGLNMIPGVNIKEIEKATFAEKAATTMNERMKNRAKDLNDSATAIQNKASELNATRAYRVQNRKKIGFGDLANDIGNSINTATENATQNALQDVTGNDSTGGKAVKTTTDDKLISDEDIQLLLDVATRDYKLNYQQVTPNITLTFGDVRETADVDSILDQVADRLEEIYDGNLEVE